SGLARRELFAGDAMRRLTNLRQLFELLALDAARTRRPLGDVARRLAALVARLAVPQPEEGNTLRAEGERDAVQIMTMHRARGVGAESVWFSGASPRRGRDVAPSSAAAAGRRRRRGDQPRLPGVLELIKRARDAEARRLYYAALTRACQRLYLPYSGNVP